MSVCGANMGGSTLTAAVPEVDPAEDCYQFPPLPSLPPQVQRLQVVRVVGALDMLP